MKTQSAVTEKSPKMQDLCVLDECIAVDVALFYKLIFLSTASSDMV